MAETPVDKAPQPKRRRRGRKVVVGILVGAILLVAGTVGFYWVLGNQALDKVQRDPSALPSEYKGRPPQAQNGAINIVLIGSDKKEDSPMGRSDVLMLLHVNPAHNKVYLLSFPRGMAVNIPGVGMHRIGSAFENGGAAMTLRVMEQVTGVRMDHVAQVDFAGFVGLTTLIGGVTVYNPTESDSRGYHFPKGNINLMGEAALVYCRERYDLPHSDLSRTERHRAVMKAILLKLMRPEVIANPVTFSQVAQSISQFVKVDSSMTSDWMRNTALSMRISSGDDIRMLQAAHITEERSFPERPGVSMQVWDKAQMAELSDALRNDKMDAYYAKYKNQPPIG